MFLQKRPRRKISILREEIELFDLNEETELSIDFNGPFICESIEKCKCILNIKQLMKFYISWTYENMQNNQNATKLIPINSYISKIFNGSYVTLIDNFNHIVFEHDNKMDIISKAMNLNQLFNVNHYSYIIKRNINKEMNTYYSRQSEVIYAQKWCDKIYCFMFNPMVISRNSYNIYENIKTNKEIQQTKEIHYQNDNKFSILYNQSVVYKYKYYYWIYYKNNDEYKYWFINNKYLTLKEEVLQ